MERSKGLIGLASWSLLVFATAAVGAFASRGAEDFYQRLQLPTWAPPASVFGPVWTVLYALMAIAAWLVWKEKGLSGARVPLALFAVQLAANALWSWVFFAWRRGALAEADIVLLLLLIATTIAAFWRVRPLAGAL